MHLKRITYDLEKAKKEREELTKKYNGELPDYLIDYFDRLENQLIKEEVFKNSDKKEKSEKDIEEFWKNNELMVASKKGPRPEAAEKIGLELLEEEKLRGIDTKHIIAACSTRMDAFAKFYFPHYLRQPNSKLHKFLYKITSKEINKKTGRGCRWAIAAPRANAKSSIISCILPIWCIVYNKKSFIIILSDTLGQASDFLADIRRELESNVRLQRDFPFACGKGSTWRVDEIVTRNDVKVLALGSGSKIRGRRFGIKRPDILICHEKGTKILYNDEWINIEEHPSAVEKIDDGYTINIHGIPYGEIVTKDHKYFCKKIEYTYDKNIGNNINRDIKNCWVPANILYNTYKFYKEKRYVRDKYWIGYKIDTSINNFQPIPEKAINITERNEKGQIKKYKYYNKYIIPKQFYDTEFWWFVGLWWGDGYSSGKRAINITINNKEPHIYNRLVRFLGKNNIKFSISSKVGCFQVIFSWAIMARWLKSWRVDNSCKSPPTWVEKIDLKYQRELVKGYIDSDGFIDYKNKCVRITSVYYEGLLSLRRILSRLNISSSIRKGIDGIDNYEICGIKCKTKRKYDIRFRDNVKQLGIDIENQDRYKFKRIFIKDGYIWSKVKEVKEVHDRIFIPIKTENSEYTTHFGLSHNCDDIENLEMVKSDTQRTDLKKWFDDDVMFVGGESGTKLDIFVVGTILGKEALLTSLVDPTKYPNFQSKIFSAVENFSDSNLWNEWEKLYTNPIDKDREITARRFFEEHQSEMLKGTRVLWPEGDPYYDLMVDRLVNPSGFLAEKMNSPIDYTKVRVKRNELHLRDFSTAQMQNLLSNCMAYGAIDPSLGKNVKTGDYSAIVVMRRDQNTGLLYVTDIIMQKMPSDTQIKYVLDLHEKNMFKLFGFETNAFQIILANLLRAESRRRGIYLPILEIQNYSDKVMRLEGLFPFIKDGTIIFDEHKYKHNRMYRSAIEQLLAYTGGKNERDDFIDALQMCFSIIRGKTFRRLTKQTGHRRRYK